MRFLVIPQCAQWLLQCGDNIKGGQERQVGEGRLMMPVRRLTSRSERISTGSIEGRPVGEQYGASLAESSQP
jgi:hypothetical protein